MRFEPLPSFDRSLKRFPSFEKERIKDKILTLVDFFETGHKPEGLGLKKLHQNIWEARIDLRVRLLFKIEDDVVSFAYVGTHDDIKRFLRNLR